MTILVIIALIVSIAALAVAVFALFVARKSSDLLRGIELRLNGIEGKDGQVAYPGLDGVVYDEKTSTMTVNGNIRANGWISAGGTNNESQ